MCSGKEELLHYIDQCRSQTVHNAECSPRNDGIELRILRQCNEPAINMRPHDHVDKPRDMSSSVLWRHSQSKLCLVRNVAGRIGGVKTRFGVNAVSGGISVSSRGAYPRR